MGATTYRVMSELTAGGEEGTDVLDDVQKYVFSSTLAGAARLGRTRCWSARMPSTSCVA